MFLECRDLTFGYQGTTKTLFKNLTFKFESPGFHSLFGSSGVGKSSLARILCGLLQPDKGGVETDAILSLLYAHNLERLPGWSSIGAHIERVTPIHNQDKKELLIRHFGLAAHLGKRFSQLSLGQKNRINLSRYLVQDFNVLIVDECLANVDEKLRARILVNIKAMFKDQLFIYISHNVIEVASYCQQIWVLRGPERDDQAVLVRGQNCRDQKCLDRASLQQTMLEIMNAA
jgi:ABC-type bacteriocin/lantibiotic exporter with double-glycine peptidase domain